MRINGFHFYTQHRVEVFICNKNINQTTKSSHLSQRSENKKKLSV